MRPRNLLPQLHVITYDTMIQHMFVLYGIEFQGLIHVRIDGLKGFGMLPGFVRLREHWIDFFLYGMNIMSSHIRPFLIQQGYAPKRSLAVPIDTVGSF